MANEDVTIGLPIGAGRVSNGNKVRGGTIAVGDGIDSATFAATKDVNSLRAALIAANGTYYTAARLNIMTQNDMVYSLLLAAGYKA